MKALNVLFLIFLVLFTTSCVKVKNTKWSGASWNMVQDDQQQQQEQKPTALRAGYNRNQPQEEYCLEDDESCDTDEECCSGYCEFDDPDYYIDYELGNPQTRQKEIMVFIGCYNGEEGFLLRKANNGDYVIPSGNILGYLDLRSKQFTTNTNSDFDMGLDSSFGSYL